LELLEAETYARGLRNRLSFPIFRKLIVKEEDIRKREVFNKYLELARQDAEKLFSDKTLFLEIPCPACGTSAQEPVIVKNGFVYCQCSGCDTLFVNPRPPVDGLRKFYAASTSARYWVNEFFRPVAEIRREKIFKPRAEYITSRFTGINEGVIGDIGAGFGIFLEEMQTVWPGCSLIAIEPSHEMAAICRSKGIEVIEKSLEDVDGLGTRFDLLTAFELFEHLHEPKMFLKKIHGLLKPGGFLFFTTLNGLGFDIQVLWRDSKSLSPPHHLNFFNPRSLSLLLRSTGFRVVECSTPGQLDWDIVESAFLNEGTEIGRLWQTFARYGSAEAKGRLQRWIQEANLSSHMRVIAQRP
jgi:SAM-dependent methyltransferase